MLHFKRQRATRTAQSQSMPSVSSDRIEQAETAKDISSATSCGHTKAAASSNDSGVAWCKIPSSSLAPSSRDSLQPPSDNQEWSDLAYVSIKPSETLKNRLTGVTSLCNEQINSSEIYAEAVPRIPGDSPHAGKSTRTTSRLVGTSGDELEEYLLLRPLIARHYRRLSLDFGLVPANSVNHTSQTSAAHDSEHEKEGFRAVTLPVLPEVTMLRHSGAEPSAEGRPCGAAYRVALPGPLVDGTQSMHAPQPLPALRVAPCESTVLPRITSIMKHSHGAPNAMPLAAMSYVQHRAAVAPVPLPQLSQVCSAQPFASQAIAPKTPMFVPNGHVIHASTTHSTASGGVPTTPHMRLVMVPTTARRINLKRNRTTLSAKQSVALQEVLSKTMFPDRETRENLAESLGLSSRCVQVWFQNQRQKERSRLSSLASRANTRARSEQVAGAITPNGAVALGSGGDTGHPVPYNIKRITDHSPVGVYNNPLTFASMEHLPTNMPAVSGAGDIRRRTFSLPHIFAHNHESVVQCNVAHSDGDALASSDGFVRSGSSCDEASTAESCHAEMGPLLEAISLEHSS